ncbi:hypothetical protein [Sulfurospirillum arcachonense]|uniref:hypothetical protein n=1 Tax=Sulfurospirillum arcachonense TaxID=57666 RepID=UPI0004B49337|nr:hypothetical protein [Sulfurospirillum arcachonense]
MTNLSISEKKALEEVFIILDERKSKKIESLKKYMMFYRYLKIFSRQKFLMIRR